MPDAPQVHTAQVHGRTLAYRMEGSGPAILLIHGMAGSSSTWNQVIGRLAEHYTVIAPDLPGHGRSEKPRTDYSLGAFAGVLRDLLVSLDIDRATVIGQSLGGGVAMQFAYQHSEHCARLVLVNAGGLGEDVMGVLRALTLPGAGVVIPLFAQRRVRDLVGGAAGVFGKLGLRPSPETVQMWKAYESLIDPDTRTAFLATLRSVVDHRGQKVSAMDRLYLAEEVPTLIVWGDHDHVIPVSHAYDAQEAIPGSRLEIFPGCGHFPHCEEPEKFARVVREFIETTDEAQLSLDDRKRLIRRGRTEDESRRGRTENKSRPNRL